MKICLRFFYFLIYLNIRLYIIFCFKNYIDINYKEDDMGKFWSRFYIFGGLVNNYWMDVLWKGCLSLCFDDVMEVIIIVFGIYLVLNEIYIKVVRIRK